MVILYEVVKETEKRIDICWTTKVWTMHWIRFYAKGNVFQQLEVLHWKICAEIKDSDQYFNNTVALKTAIKTADKLTFYKEE